MEWLEYVIKTYGYLALVFGTFLEGETILIIAGMAARSGLLDVNLAILAAFVGSMSGDQLYFIIGRFKGQWLLHKKPAWRPRIQKALDLLERHSTWVLLTFRFMYGLRNVTTFAVGMSRVRTLKFISLNAIGAMVWALSFGYGGYLCGEAMVRLAEGVKRYEKAVIACVVIVALLVWVIRLWRKRAAAIADASDEPLADLAAPIDSAADPGDAESAPATPDTDNSQR